MPGSGWLKLYEKTRVLNINRENINIVEAVYQKGNDKIIFLYWYRMKDIYITNEYMLKYYMILHSLKYRRNDAAFIRFSSRITMGLEATMLFTENAVKEFLPLIEEYLPE